MARFILKFSGGEVLVLALVDVKVVEIGDGVVVVEVRLPEHLGEVLEIV